MTNRTACGFALLLLVQAMSAALYVLPTEYEQNDWQGPVFESGARSNNSSSGCGYDVNYTSLYTNAPAYVLSTSTVSVWINTYCDLLNTPMYLTASLANQNNGSTYGVANASYNGSNVSFSSNWSIPASTLGVGNYTLTATLQYYDGSTWTTIETDTHNFSIIAPVTNPCGVDPNSASIYAYSYSTGNQLGSNFTGAITTYCSITNATMVLDWTIRSLTTNASIDSGSFNWTGVNTSVGHNVTSNALASMGVGNYSFEATLSWYNNSSMAWEVLDIDSYAFFVYNNTNSGPGSLGCGYDLNYTDMYAYAPYYAVVNQSIDTTMYVQCPVYNASMFLNYWIYDASNTTLDSGNYSWTASTNQTWHYWNATSLAAGNYIFHVELYSNGSYVTSDSDGFTVMNNNTGNNTGGNGTGNNTGGNNTGNNTGNNSTHNVAHCLHLRNISVDSSYYVSVDLENTCSTDINYPGINASTNDPGVSGLSDTWWYLLWANGTYNSGWQLSFNQSVQNNTLITLNFNATILNCGPNGYHACPNSMNSSSSYQFTYITPGGNSTGGNNTGGNNTGNNTGGNNTGGNNTGGNNTGGNNTGGNSTNQLTYYAYQQQYCFSTAEDIEIFMTISGLNATEFYLEWEITSGSTMVASGSPLINVNSSGIVSYVWTFNTTALSSGVYTVMLNPADSGLSNLFSNSPYYYNIEVDCNNTGGNNTGGNNTGGNNTGGNNTGGNNTGGNNTGNNTGGNNTILDADGDGVLDADDLCPNSTPGVSVDSTGCEASVQPVNNAPEVTNVIITPMIATVDDTLSCGYSTTDSDGDAVTTTVTWAVNGSIISTGSDTLTGGFGVGQTVTCTVIASDGAASSSPFVSTTIILPSGSDEIVEDASGLLPSLSMMGTLVAIAFGVGLTRRQDD